MSKTTETLESVVVRFAGDSGDGMQLTGTQFTETTALAGNDVATFPDYPAEIRAPAGTLAGVSGFQVQFSSHEVFTPGDSPDVLVAMNPAALKANLMDVPAGAVIIVNTGGFDKKSIERCGFKDDPLKDGTLSGYKVFEVDITAQTLKAIEGLPLTRRIAERTKNFYALGLVYWLFDRSVEHSLAWIEQKFKKAEPGILEANIRALKAGYAFGETAEMFAVRWHVPRAPIAPGRYKNLSGNEALALGFVAASELSGLDLFLASYPITPASDILHFLSKQKAFGVRTLQAEDEIAAMAAAIGAAYGGALALTTTSGPGLALKSEGSSLGMMLELPMIIVDVQRGGPSTGLPTKTEQSDLLQAMFGRHGESPLPVIAACTPGDCFWTAIEAARIALRHMTPVIVLTDGSLANGAEPFRIPDVSTIAKIPVEFRTEKEGFQPYARNAQGARPWALPGTPGLEHRVGGLEKANLTGAISYDGANHELMSRLRAEKVQKVADSYPKTEVFGAQSGKVLVVGWGGTFGALRSAVTTMHAQGASVGHLHLRYLNPLPHDLGDVLKKFDKILVPELNLGQLAMLLRARYLVNAESLSKMQGKPFKEAEITRAVLSRIEGYV